MSGILYVVGTPIGNLGDITLRQLEILEQVSFIAAEDTRVTRKLLSHFDLHTPLVSYHEHSTAAAIEQIMARIRNGETCACVTDAGMPCISDPGSILVQHCMAEQISIQVIPGPSAVIAALAISGQDTGRFCFEGFLSVNKKQRHDHLESLRNEHRTMVFYEAPHKLRTTLSDLLRVLGNRQIALCRELTKLNEEIIRTTLSEAVKRYEIQSPRGEFVLVLAGAEPDSPKENAFWSDLTVWEHVAFYLDRGMKKNDAIKQAAHDRGVAKSRIYNIVMKKEDSSLDGGSHDDSNPKRTNL